MKTTSISEGDLVVIRSFSREAGYDTDEDYAYKKGMLNRIFKIRTVLAPHPKDPYTYEVCIEDDHSWTTVYFQEDELELAFSI